jgi:hypothetical protein
VGKHSLPGEAYSYPADARQRGVSDETFDRWIVQFIVRTGFEGNAHAACDCTSYDEHQQRSKSPFDQFDFAKYPIAARGPTVTEIPVCAGPLATVLHERWKDAFVAKELRERFPWLSRAELNAIVAWKPGDPPLQIPPQWSMPLCVNDPILPTSPERNPHHDHDTL